MNMRKTTENKHLSFASITLLSLSVISTQSFANGLPDTLDKVKPSVVAVGTYMPKRDPRAIFSGTGFAVGDGRYIVTNVHVIAGQLHHDQLEERAIFYVQDGEYKMTLATEVATDSEHDVALLKLKEGHLPALKLAQASSVREGQMYAFTGFPMGMVFGLHAVTHRGMISAITPNAIPQLNVKQLNMKLIRQLDEPFNVFQLDATAYPGNSGSPLYNTETGEVVGIINKVFVQESKENVLSNPSGISYAIPVNYIEALLNKK
jgi:S1-C subfamily serine protease